MSLLFYWLVYTRPDGMLRDSPNVKKDKDRVQLYTADAVARHGDVSLTAGGMVLVAVLSGGDYSKVRVLHYHCATAAHILTLVLGIATVRSAHCSRASSVWARRRSRASL